MFVHLNTHSIYSPMRGLLSLPEMMDLAKSCSMGTLALTDVNGLWGFIRFVQHCRSYRINPIAGVNLITNKQEVLILVENQHGYENLCRIISSMHDDPNRDIPDILRKYHSGVFVLGYDISIMKELSNFIPDSHLFVELRPGFQESTIKNISKELKLEIVATGDVYFKNKSFHKTHMALRAIDCNSTLSDLNECDYKSEDHWFRSEAEMVHLFPNSLDALNNSKYLADRCKTDWSFINTIFPSLSLKDRHQANKRLNREVSIGAKKRYGHLNDEVSNRIKYELTIINQKGFSPYFLIVKDIVTQTRATIGRGSAAASIVSYCLFITQVDPIKYRLRFEGFIHPEREDMPDIDVDFPWDERDNILQYVFSKYGTERTAMVANQVFMKHRSAVRETGKIYGLSNEEIKSITKRIGWYSKNRNLKYWVKTDPRFSNVEIDDDLSNILEDSGKIIGAFRHASVHPGGVVIVPDEIRKHVPVLMAPKGVQIVEWEKDQVEDSGLLKIDLLGNRSLAVVRDTIRQINLNNQNQQLDEKYLDYHRIHPVGDKKTEDLMSSGKTMGVFYIESPSVRQLLEKSGIVDFDHVVIYSSIIRPAANRYMNLMLKRIHGEKWSIIHPDLGFLNETYGIMVYKEQVSMTIMQMTGLGYADTKKLMKVISRDSTQHLVPPWKTSFVKNSINRGYSKTMVEEVWDMISSFVGYSFCKPHSASYAMLSFTCAYLKTHFPAEFLAAVISNQGGYYSSYAYMSEARRFGVTILTPDINHSRYEWYGNNNTIQMGFMSIKGLRKSAIHLILDERKAGDFDSLDDFLMRVTIDLADAILLTNAGCLSCLEPTSNHQQIAYRIAGFYLQEGSRKPLTFNPINNTNVEHDNYRMELEAFGYPISSHPLTRYRHLVSNKIKCAREIPDYVGKSIYLLGVYITKKETKTKQSEAMQFLTLEDESDIYECVMFPKEFREFGDLLNWETLLIIRGTIEKSFGVFSVTIEKMASLQQWVARLNQRQFLN